MLFHLLCLPALMHPPEFSLLNFNSFTLTHHFNLSVSFKILILSSTTYYPSLTVSPIPISKSLSKWYNFLKCTIRSSKDTTNTICNHFQGWYQFKPILKNIYQCPSIYNMVKAFHSFVRHPARVQNSSFPYNSAMERNFKSTDQIKWYHT